MKLNILSKAVSFRETAWIPDPWGVGAEFEVLREGCRRLRGRAKERLSAAPARQETLRAVVGKLLRETAAKAPEGEGTDEAPGQARTGRTINELLRETTADLVDEGKLAPEDVLGMRREGAAEAALDRLVGWRGVTTEDGEEWTFSEERALELLTDDSIVDAGLVGEGETVGAVLSATVLAGSRMVERFRTEALEEAEGESEAGSDSGASAGPA